MNFATISPSSHLRSFVRFFWTLSGNGPYTHHAMADIYPEILFHVKGHFYELDERGKKVQSFRSGIHGHTSKTHQFTVNSGFSILGVCLYPYTLPMLFGIPASELTDNMPELDEVLGREVNSLTDQVLSTDNSQTQITVIQKFLERKIVKSGFWNDAMPLAVRSVIESRGNIRVNQLAEEYCLSLRQFERRFKEASGFSPKLFSRIARFNHTLEQFGNHNLSLSQLAQASGYYDQSHFIHDFKRFSGHHPGSFFKGRSEATAWRE